CWSGAPAGVSPGGPFVGASAARITGPISGARALSGARGRPRADVAALARLLSNLSRFAWEAGERLRSVDLNPVIALPEGQGAWAVDAVLEVEEVADGARS
ncbi:acetate--CoA ligase family protein, partial [Pseudomonas aeruginosa]